MKKALYLFLLLALALWGLYQIPVSRRTFSELFGGDLEQRAAFEAFRQLPTSELSVDGYAWDYLRTGAGEETVLFLHGMGGSYDIWWQQIDALRDSFQIVSVTYPAIPTMEGMARGVLAILDEENIEGVHLVGTSLGGAFAQYLAAHHPERIRTATFGNTFLPNQEFYDAAHPRFRFIPYFPAWLVMRAFRKGVIEDHYPASGYSELVRAYLLEQGYGRMSKKQFTARAQCVLDIFPERLPATIPLLVIESDNDPLLPPEAREMLRQGYPQAKVYTFQGEAGHFVYLNRPQEYSRVLMEHFGALAR